MRLHVCAKGLSGTAKTRKDEAPSDAISGRDARLDCVIVSVLPAGNRRHAAKSGERRFCGGRRAGATAQPVGPELLGERRQLHFHIPGMPT